MAVNVSAMEFRDENFLKRVFAILDTSGLNPALLELELTETVLMRDAGATETILTALRARGIQVAVDDFGTGYSSLSYLKKFTVDSLKIDQSFVRQIMAAPDEPIVSAVINLGRSLNLRVVAEGVEEREEAEFLEALQCDEAQGNYYSHPLTPTQFGALLVINAAKTVAAHPAESFKRLRPLNASDGRVAVLDIPVALIASMTSLADRRLNPVDRRRRVIDRRMKGEGTA
jgi:EAL domain-containing protein (putative c-di-GMP-specific phosphodiesterase class I)